MKSYGDKHFMVDDELIERIVAYGKVGGKDTVLEVGAGYGSLTKALAQKAKKVIAVEKDRQLFQELEDSFGSAKNVELINADATKIVFPKVNKIVSNLPYSISRKITLKFLALDFELAVLVYQREFARKLLAKAGDDDYRFISVLAQTTSEAKILEEVGPEAFSPQPNIVSCVLELKPKRALTGSYASFVKTLFNQKNKKIKNIVAGAPEEFSELRPKNISPKETLLLYGKVA